MANTRQNQTGLLLQTACFRPNSSNRRAEQSHHGFQNDQRKRANGSFMDNAGEKNVTLLIDLRRTPKPWRGSPYAISASAPLTYREMSDPCHPICLSVYARSPSSSSSARAIPHLRRYTSESPRPITKTIVEEYSITFKRRSSAIV